MKKINLFCGDSAEELLKIKDESVDLLATDPPYAIKFMGKKWDKALPNIEIFKQCYRVLKPGAFAFVMCSVRSDASSRMSILLEDAGFKINFSPIYWTYSSGFPKGYNMGQSAEKKLTIGKARRPDRDLSDKEMTRNRWGDDTKGVKASTGGQVELTKEEAIELQNSFGGFQPKPAVELIIVAMKPMDKKTFVEQALHNKKGITWLKDCKVPGNPEAKAAGDRKDRLPSNLSVSDEILGDYSKYFNMDAWWRERLDSLGYENEEKLFPFFEVKKPNKNEKDQGLDDFEYVDGGVYLGNADSKNNNTFSSDPSRIIKQKKNPHPTVKPIKLFSYLVNLGCETGGIVLDPFMGSGTSGIACCLNNRKFIGIEMDKKYYDVSEARISHFCEMQENLSSDGKAKENEKG
jgi:DNA modification methylase